MYMIFNLIAFQPKPTEGGRRSQQSFFPVFKRVLKSLYTKNIVSKVYLICI